jgi:hypothetical protein
MRCPACSAPLTATGGSDFTTCGHCGTQIQVSTLARGASSGGGSAAGIVITLVLVGVGLMVVFGGVAAYFMFSAVDELDDTTIELARNTSVSKSSSGSSAGSGNSREPESAKDEAAPASVAAEPEDKGMPLSKLPELSHSGWTKVDAPNMAGSYAEFDPIANLAWAQTIAQAWSQDAVFVRMDASGVRPNGFVDLSTDTSDWNARYTFVSPARREIAKKMAEVSEDPFYSEMRIHLDESTSEVRLDTERLQFMDDPPPPLPKKRCALEPALQALQTPEGGLPKRPRYDMSLRWRQPYTGLQDWLIEADGSHKGVFLDTCALWSLDEARARNSSSN